MVNSGVKKMSSHPLFSTFPREVLALARPNEYGNKIASRSVVLSKKELNLFIQKYSGVQDPYVGSFIYKGDIGSTIVDKLPFDFDDEHSEYAPIFAKWLYEHKIGYVTIGTHFDRYHIYVPVYPQQLTPLELQEAQLSLLEQAGIYKKMTNNSNSIYYQPMSDVHIIGDIRRVMRIPNTPRLPEKEGDEITCYCTYLPQNFYEMDKTLLYSLLKRPHEMEIPDYFPKPLYEIVKPLTIQFRSVTKLDRTEEILSEYTPTDPLLRFVQSLLRPCIWSVLNAAHPPQFIRVAATIDLRELGFSQLDVFDIYSRFNWDKWSPEITDYQISNIFGSMLQPYSCSKIRGSNVPCIDGCKYKSNSYIWMVAKR